MRFYPSVKPRESFFILDPEDITPGATALTLMPRNEVSSAVVSTSMFNIAIEVDRIIEPG